jgi:hypothetical protein
MGIYEYMYGQGFYVPRLYTRYLLKNIKDRYGVECDGFYAEAYPQWALDGPKYWLVSKLLWNVDYDVESLWRDYCTQMFGPAAQAMRAYFDYLEETWCTQTLDSNRSNYRWMNDPRQLEIFPPDRCRQARQLLDAAAAKAEGVHRERIAFFGKGLTVTTELSRRHNHALTIEKLLASKAAATDAAAHTGLILSAVDQWLDGPPITEIFRLRGEAGLDQTRPETIESFDYHWNRSPAPLQAIHDLSERVAGEAVKGLAGARSMDAYQREVDKVVAAMKQQHAATPADRAWQQIGDVAKTVGVLPVRDAAGTRPPMVDGAIADGEWGDPVFDGRFHRAFMLADHSDNRTLIYAREHGDGKLYLAFDCRQDPQTIGADVSDIAQDQKYPYKMTGDDAISINLKRHGLPFQTYRVNAAGTWDSPQQKGLTVAVSRSDAGWQAEMIIENGALSKSAVEADGGPAVAISRYERSRSADGKTVKAQCTTFRPVARVGGHVGSGNHEQLMAFVWGPRLLYQTPPKTAEAATK